MLHFILGTRAQLIKMAPIMLECRKRGIRHSFIFIAQHRETMYEMMSGFGVRPPDFVLGDVGREIARIQDMVPWCFKVLWEGLRRRKELFPQGEKGIAVVHGDALPVILGALLAKSAGIEVAHVEAGLRSFNFLHPFPEELIRVLTWELGLVDYYFCPNAWALGNLARYGGRKYDTRHNTLLDSLRLALARKPEGGEDSRPLDRKYALVSIHRFETISSRERLESVLSILESVPGDIKLVFILHPSTRQSLTRFGLVDRILSNPNVEIRNRSSYLEFISLLKGSEFLISDGGSNQEECYYMGHPCLLLRNTTERIEGLGGNVVLSDFDGKAIDYFVRNYASYRSSEPSLTESPASTIVDLLTAGGQGISLSE